MPKSKKKFTGKQTAFIREYVIDHNATQAAIRAGYSKKTAGMIGDQNLKKLYIAKEIQKLDAIQAAECGISAKKTKMEIARIAYADIKERAADRMPYSSKIAALKMAGQVDALFVEKVEVSGEITIEVELTDD